MWNRRTIREEPSEVDSPMVWKEIHLKNRAVEMERNHPRAPLVRDVPTSWLCVVMWMFMMSYVASLQSILHL